MLEVLVCGSFCRLSTNVSQVLIKLLPPPHIYGLLQRCSNYMLLLVWDGSLSVNILEGAICSGVVKNKTKISVVRAARPNQSCMFPER